MGILLADGWYIFIYMCVEDGKMFGDFFLSFFFFLKKKSNSRNQSFSRCKLLVNISIYLNPHRHESQRRNKYLPEQNKTLSAKPDVDKKETFVVSHNKIPYI